MLRWQSILSLLFLFACSYLLISCGGGGGEESSNEQDNGTPTVGPTGIVDNLKTTNLDGSGFPWIGIAIGLLKRWDIANDGLIPVKTNNVNIADQALDRIETEIGLKLFDRTLIAATPDDAINRGIIVSEGTALGPNGEIDNATCGHVSRAIGETGYPTNFYDSSGNINTVLYVHLSSSQCAANTEIAIHEFGHALGMGEHFSGFGIGAAIDNNFWNVLYNLYNNNVGAPESSLVITQLKS